MWKSLIVAGILWALCDFNGASGGTWYVAQPPSGDDLNPGTEALPFATIQKGIDEAAHGDVVIVAQGTYFENILFKGENIIVQSKDPLDSKIVGKTIIDGGSAGSVVTFAGTEDETCVLSGFTIRNGNAAYEYGGYGGGICGGMCGVGPGPRENVTHATIRNNVIIDNAASRGGGVAYCDGLILNNTISRNSAGRGGALRLCHGTIENNIITGNTATGEGAGGLDNCNGIIQNNVISENSGLDSDSDGGLGGCDGIIQNNLIIGNSSRGGAGGLSWCDGAILNNTVVRNSVTGDEAMAGGLAGCGGIIRNCIIWGNTAPDGAQLSNCSEPAYSCIQGWSGGGAGNTGQPPAFVDAPGGDYHLQPESPCVDGGINYYWCAWPQRDINGNCRLAGEQVDMGCYELNSSPDSDGDLLSDADEISSGTDRADADTDGDGLRDGLELLRETDPLTPTAPAILHVPSDVPTLQKALCLALNGDEFIVSPGTYQENLQFCGADVVLRSSDPTNSGILASTVLDGGGAGPVVSLTGRESKECALSGFTIRNGKAGTGGGIHGGFQDHPTHATIQNNTITGNVARYRGGGLAFCDGAVENNTISGNSARSGAGLYQCNGTIQNNIIRNNSASYSGGALNECHGVVRNNTIIGNSADRDGGGLYFCTGTIVNCIIWGNTAEDGPHLYQCHEPAYCCIQAWTGSGEGNILEAPRFADAEGGDLRLLPSSPCIDAGESSVVIPEETDMAGMHRILYGGKSVTVDMGAYEFYINLCERGGQPDEVTLTWSSLVGKSYSIFYTSDLSTWHLAHDAAPSAGDQTTSWTDDGSKTGNSPSLTDRRFYRIIENP